MRTSVATNMSSITVSCEADDEAAWFSLHVASAGELPFYVRRQWSELRALAVEARQPHARVLQPATAPCSRALTALLTALLTLQPRTDSPPLTAAH